MHRESRKLLTELERLAKQNNITTMVTLGEVYQCDQLVMKYYINPVLNMIHNKLKHISKKSSKHFTAQYWVTIIETSFSNNMSVRRDCGFDQIDRNNPPASYQIMMNYLPPCDYGDSVVMTMIELSHKYSDDAIIKSINIGKQNNVYSVQYIKAILEREAAVHEIEMQKIGTLASKAESAKSILDRNKVDNSITDVASAAYNWEKAKEDADLIAQFNAMFGGNDETKADDV